MLEIHDTLGFAGHDKLGFACQVPAPEGQLPLACVSALPELGDALRK